MPLYDKPLTRIIAEDALNDLPETFSSQQMINWIETRYPKFKESTIRAHLRSMSANDPNKKHYNSPLRNVLFRLGKRVYRRYDAERDGIYDEEGRTVDDSPPSELEEEEEEPQEPSEEEVQFALEQHLEDFMQANWDRINFGGPLKLYQAEDGRIGRQYSTEIGVIDFLCEDSSSGELVVIELKKGRSSDKVLGQCQRYMGWVQEKLATPNQGVRGLIIAPEQDERLRYALRVAQNVEMLCYRVDFQLFNPNVETGK